MSDTPEQTGTPPQEAPAEQPNAPARKPRPRKVAARAHADAVAAAAPVVAAAAAALEGMAPPPAEEIPVRGAPIPPADEEAVALGTAPEAPADAAAPPADEEAVALGTAPAAPEAPVADAGPPLDEEIAVRVAGAPSPEALAEELRQVEAELREVEVEIRNAGGDGASAGVTGMAASVLRLVGENVERMAGPQIQAVQQMLDQLNLRDYLDPDFWQGIGMVLRYQIEAQVDFIRRRIAGEYEVDPFGMDREIIEIVRPFQSFMYRSWFRTSTDGIEQIPGHGRAMLVANHGGVIPWDGAMIATAVAEERDDLSDRVVRSLYLNSYNNLPMLAAMLPALGQVPSNPDNARRLLEGDELVCVFPEGDKGAGKLFKDRYKLARFGKGGYVQAAMRAGAPIVPVAVVGSEETYPILANVEPLAKLLNLPYFPITPFFPWLGPLGTLPLPTRWSITFGEPVDTARYGPEAADDPLTVFMLSEQIRASIQETLNEKLAGRGSVF